MIDGQESKTLAAIIADAIDRKLIDMNTAMPCIVQSYDASRNLASVQPSIRKKLTSQVQPINLPIIVNVPVLFPRAGQAFISLPVVAGDEGLLIFCQRSIDRWIDEGGIVDPQDRRKFSLADAVFITGLHSQSKPLNRKASNNSMELTNGNATIELNASGKFKITNGAEELIALLIDVTDGLIDTIQEVSMITTTVSAFGVPTPIDNMAAFTALKSSVESLKALIEKLKV